MTAGRWGLPDGGREMSGQTPGHAHESVHVDDRRAVVEGLVAALLMSAAIIGLFMFITWAMVATS